MGARTKAVAALACALALGCGEGASGGDGPIGCNDLDCEGELNRTCEEREGRDAECGPCLPGFQPGFGGFCDPASTPMGPTVECGVNSLSAPGTETVSFSEPVESPIVLAPALSRADPEPAHPRIVSVRSDGFDVDLEEWSYLDGNHDAEWLHWVAVSAGTGTWSGARRYQAGTVQADHEPARVDFESPLVEPVILANAVTRNGSSPIVVRISDATSDGFRVQVQEEEANDGTHAVETIHYLAVEGGAPASDSPWAVGSVPDVTEVPVDVTSVLDALPSQPRAVIFNISTLNGSDPVVVRWIGDMDRPEQVFVEEEQSSDDEIGHVPERIDWLACF